MTISQAARVTPPYDPKIESPAAEDTGCAVTVKVADVAPAGMVTLAGTVARAGSALDSVTVAPPPGAAPFRVTVPVNVLGLAMTPGESGEMSASRCRARRIERCGLGDLPGRRRNATQSISATGCVVTVNVAVVFPEATVTLGGTVAAPAVLLLDRPTTVPPAGAGPASVTVPAELCPAVTWSGETATDSTPGSAATAAALTPGRSGVITRSSAQPPGRKMAPSKSASTAGERLATCDALVEMWSQESIAIMSQW